MLENLVRFVTREELESFPVAPCLYTIEHIYTPAEAAARELERQERRRLWAEQEAQRR